VSHLRIIFAGGGTGGHLFPALAIADSIRRIDADAKILFIGTKGRTEEKVVPQSGYEFKTVWVSGFTRGLKLKNLIFPLKLVVSLLQSFFIITKFKPDVAVGTGGFVSGPVLYVATLLRIPTLIQDHNSYPGVTTRLLSSRANEVHIAFESSKKYFKRKDNLRLTGSPVRILDTADKTQALQNFDLELGRKTLFVTGGSQGATSINRALLKILEDVVKHGFQVIWQTGAGNYNTIKSECSRFGTRVWAGKFIDKIGYAYAACDLTLSRAGATTIAELTLLGVPAILVPYPHAAANHQAENARVMVAAGAAEIISDDDLDVALKDTLIRLMDDDEKLRNMGEQSRKLGQPDAAVVIAQCVLRLGSRSNKAWVEGGGPK
jgi:UDP-N-acetylglucosamine--N-acetylmuramyl-(pentapeptide) pyrophosphoryl-undecaprenol N-acetylglucosamine transferase